MRKTRTNTSETYPSSIRMAEIKKSRYGWADADRSSPGELRMVPVDELRVDRDSYQRELQSDGKRTRLAATFNWVSCGVLIVARRADGTLWIVDGQHRWEAARTRGDIESLPCVIFDIASIQGEAKAFLQSNTERRALRVFEQFRAQVAESDPIAMELKGMFDAAGRVPAGGCGGAPGRTIACVGACRKCMSSDPMVFRRIWPLVLDLCQGESIDSRLLYGLWTLERRLIGRSVLDPVLQRRLLTAGREAILRAIGESCAYHHRGGEVYYARGILKLLNHRARIAIRMKGSGEQDTAE